MHSGKTFKTVLGDISFDKKGDVSGGYQVGGKIRGTYVLHIWRKAPDGKFSYFEE